MRHVCTLWSPLIFHRIQESQFKSETNVVFVFYLLLFKPVPTSMEQLVSQYWYLKTLRKIIYAPSKKKSHAAIRFLWSRSSTTIEVHRKLTNMKEVMCRYLVNVRREWRVFGGGLKHLHDVLRSSLTVKQWLVLNEILPADHNVAE